MLKTMINNNQASKVLTKVPEGIDMETGRTKERNITVADRLVEMEENLELDILRLEALDKLIKEETN